MTGRFRKCSTVGLGQASTSVSAHRSAAAYFIIAECQITRHLKLEPCQSDFSLTAPLPNCQGLLSWLACWKGDEARGGVDGAGRWSALTEGLRTLHEGMLSIGYGPLRYI